MLVLVVTWWFFHPQFQSFLSFRLLLNSNNPSEEFFNDLARKAEDPVDFLQRCWMTGKITHRQLVAMFLKENAPANSSWFARAEPLALACAIDADSSVRELGLAALTVRGSPRLLDAAQAQLKDVDPLIRMLGLDYVRKSDPKNAVPILIRLLDDPDLRIVVAAEVGLMRLSGEDFGVRMRLAMPPEESSRPGKVDPANAEVINKGVERRKEWWRVHQKDYVPTSGSSPPVRITDQPRPPVADFMLNDLNGKPVKLSDFKGKVVLLNFWATWCTACLAEIPELVALKEKMGPQVAIIGVALDGVPDEEGDTPGEEADEKSHKRKPSLSALRAKVERAVRAHHINYPVLLDPKNSVGGQYNGGELPTTIILDSTGRVRRRFIGERELSVFQAMLTEAGKPLVAAATRPLP
jgi:thiol-disulfide isomerase/thioredoxin